MATGGGTGEDTEGPASASLEVRDWSMDDPCANCGQTRDPAVTAETADDWEDFPMASGSREATVEKEKPPFVPRLLPPGALFPPGMTPGHPGLPPPTHFFPPALNPLQNLQMTQQYDFMQQLYMQNLMILPPPSAAPLGLGPGAQSSLPEQLFPPPKRGRSIHRDPPPPLLLPLPPFALGPCWSLPKPGVGIPASSHLPFGLPPTLQPHPPKKMSDDPRQSSSSSSSPQSAAPVHLKSDSPDGDNALSCDELPLDLSFKNGSNGTSVDGGGMTAEKLRTPRKPSKPKKLLVGESTEEKCTNNPAECTCKNCEDTVTKTPFGSFKRNYSQTDLNQAVNDIRNGRLGTRRASVVYGIPRSTLRNKIYKLEAAEEQQGIVTSYRRRKPGGQSNAEKRLAEESERARLIGASPADDGEGSSESTEEAKEEDGKSESNEKTTSSWDVQTPPDWARLWQTMLTQQFVNASEELIRPPADLLNGVVPQLIPQLNGTKPGIAPPPAFFSPPPSQAHRLPTQVVSSTASTDENADWKRIRPKRGQYRKYDKIALDEAVKSVRRGEMSVHRAGSFFGVPHSTLEYKVKERNLMRAKRKKEASAGVGEGGTNEEVQIVNAPAVTA